MLSPLDTNYEKQFACNGHVYNDDVHHKGKKIAYDSLVCEAGESGNKFEIFWCIDDSNIRIHEQLLKNYKGISNFNETKYDNGNIELLQSKEDNYAF